MAILKRTSSLVIGALEKIFYSWGVFVARRPYTIIIASIFITSLCCIGIKDIRYEARSDKMWIPADSSFISNQAWIDKNFKGTGQRIQSLIFRSEHNILTPEALIEMFRHHQRINALRVQNLTYSDFCYRLPIADIFLKRRKRSPTGGTKKAVIENLDLDTQYRDSYYPTPFASSKDDAIQPARLVVNQQKVDGSNIIESSNTIQSGDEDGGDYNYDEEYDEYDYYNYEQQKHIDYNDFSSLENEIKYDASQREIANGLPPSVYCDLVNTLNSKCFESSILEIWRYHEETIMKLTQEDIVYAINVVRKSPYFGYPTDYAGKLGGIVRNESGHIVAANSVFHSWITTVDEDKIVKSGIAIDIDQSDQLNLDWESEVVKMSLQQDEKWFNGGVDITVKVNVQRSFNDISTKALFVDVPKVVIGYIMMFAYTTIMLGRFNMVEQRFYLTAAGLTAVLMGIGIAVGITSALGFPYIPLHALLPFVCLGIGIDDMFVIVQCLNNLKPSEVKGLSIEQKIGLTMKHAGVAITVTSLTDVFAFGIGAVTILPGLQAFCVSCSFAIGAIYLLQASWFAAWLSIDEKRIKERRNAWCPMCIRHSENWQPSECSQKEIGKTLIGQYSRLLNFQIFKICVVILTLCAAGVGLWGTISIKNQFDPSLLLPADSYLRDWIYTHKHDFPKDGWGSDLYTGPINPQHDLSELDSLINDMEKLTKGKDKVLRDVDSWWLAFKYYTHNKKNISNTEQYNPQNFSMELSNFLFSQVGAYYKPKILLDGDLTCNSPAPPIIATKIGFGFQRFSGPTEHVPGRRAVEDVIQSHNLTSPTFTFSKIYAAWETDEIIGKELWRNIGLAMIGVFVITLLLLADVAICVMVLICVVLTLVDIVGMLHFWNITIDTLSCVNVVLAVGLSVDYSAHVAHSFIVAKGSSIERAQSSLTTIGPAIINGGITTLLAVLLLYFSESHAFLTFFKVFFLTVTFGLFHGVILLPVVLSWVGSTSPGNDISAFCNASSNNGIKSNNENCVQAFSNGHNIPTYNSVQDRTMNNMNGSCNLAFAGSNAELDKSHTPNFSKSDSNSAPKYHRSTRWHPFTRFNRTLAINE